MTTTYPDDSLAAHPPSLHPDYSSTRKRAPLQPLVIIPHTLSELTGPAFGHEAVQPGDADLTRQHAGEPLGERIIVSGRVLDESGRPVPDRSPTAIVAPPASRAAKRSPSRNFRVRPRASV